MTVVMAVAVRKTPKKGRAGLEMHTEDVAHLVLAAGEMMARMQISGRSPREVRRFVRSTLSVLFPEDRERVVPGCRKWPLLHEAGRLREHFGCRWVTLPGSGFEPFCRFCDERWTGP